jgi:hypothetical protein
MVLCSPYHLLPHSVLALALFSFPRLGLEGAPVYVWVGLGWGTGVEGGTSGDTVYMRWEEPTAPVSVCVHVHVRLCMCMHVWLFRTIQVRVWGIMRLVWRPWYFQRGSGSTLNYLYILISITQNSWTAFWSHAGDKILWCSYFLSWAQPILGWDLSIKKAHGPAQFIKQTNKTLWDLLRIMYPIYHFSFGGTVWTIYPHKQMLNMRLY